MTVKVDVDTAATTRSKY